MHDSGTLLPRDKAVERAATPEEQREILALVRRGLEEGALGDRLGNRLYSAGIARRDSGPVPAGGARRKPRSTFTCATADRWSRA